MKTLLELLNKSQKNTSIPIWLMRQAGRYLPEYQELRKQNSNFLNFCYEPNFACEATLQPIKRFKFLDAAIIFSDILVIPDSMGINLKFEENQGPILDPVRNLEQFNKILENKNLKKLDKVYQAIKNTKEKLPNEVALIGFAGAPWTIASYIVEGKLSKDFFKIKSTYYNDKPFINNLIECLIEQISNHLINQAKAGAEILQLFDSWAGVLIEEDYEQLVIKPNQKIIENVRKAIPNIPIICFPRMSGLQYEKFCDQVDCNAISVDQYMPLSWIKNHSNGKIIQGNLDPLVLLSESQDFIKSRIDKVLENIDSKRFIFNLGHGVVPKTPVKNVEFLVNYIKEFKVE